MKKYIFPIVVMFFVVMFSSLVTAQTYTMQFHEGYNLWGAPLDILVDYGSTQVSADDVDTAFILIAINDQSDGSNPCMFMFRWNGGSFNVRIFGVPTADSIPMNYPEGYYIHCTEDITVTFEGNLFPSTAQLTLEEGNNLINFPININPRTVLYATELLTQFNEQGVDCPFMYRWTGSNWEIVSRDNIGFGNFRIQGHEGYWVHCVSSGTVTVS